MEKNKKDKIMKHRSWRQLSLAFLITAAMLSVCACQSDKTAEAESQGLVLYEESSYEEAIEAFLTVLEQNPENAAVYVNLGMAYLKNEDKEPAKEAFEKALELESENRLALRGMGLYYLESGEFDEAISQFDQALAIKKSGGWDSADLDILLYKAKAQELSSDLSGAINTYTQLIENNADNADYYYLRGVCYLKNEALEGALADFDKGISTGSKTYAYYVNIYETLKAYNQEETGKSYLEQALSLSVAEDSGTDEYSDADKSIRGQIKYLLGDFSGAVNELEAIETVTDAKTYLYLGMCYQEQGEDDKAYEAFAQALNLEPENASLYNQLGLYKMETGEYSSALSYFQSGQALEESDLTKELVRNEGICCEKMGDYAKALEVFTGYQERFGYEEDIAHEIEFLKTR